MKAKGFTKNVDFGFVFPGIDMTRYDKPAENKIDLTKPKMKIGAISGEGKIKIEFDQPMLAPDNIDPKMYTNVFEFSMKSDVDGSIIKGRYLSNKETSQPSITQRVLKGLSRLINEQSEADRLAFGVQVTNHDP